MGDPKRLLPMTSMQSRKVLAGKVAPFLFHFDPGVSKVRLDGATGTKLFSFESVYNAINEAVEV